MTPSDMVRFQAASKQVKDYVAANPNSEFAKQYKAAGTDGPNRQKIGEGLAKIQAGTDQARKAEAALGGLSKTFGNVPTSFKGLAERLLGETPKPGGEGAPTTKPGEPTGGGTTSPAKTGASGGSGKVSQAPTDPAAPSGETRRASADPPTNDGQSTGVARADSPPVDATTEAPAERVQTAQAEPDTPPDRENA